MRAEGPLGYQSAVAPGAIQAICAQALGPGARVVRADRLGGGEINTTYLVHLRDREPVVLRVAPPDSSDLAWHERDLMRRELALQPYLAPIASRLPRVIAADFTHRLLPRDHVLLSHLPGERWSDLTGRLDDDDSDALWRQLASLVRTIASVTGEAFGWPPPGSRFARWSETVRHWLDRAVEDAAARGLETAALGDLGPLLRRARPWLDEIGTPRLMHGDLVPVNLLVERRAGRPAITGVLDHDRGLWGDPLSDWTFFLLEQRAPPRARRVFWEAFGAPELDRGGRIRRLVYRGLHHANVLTAVDKMGRADLVARVQARLAGVAVALEAAAGRN